MPNDVNVDRISYTLTDFSRERSTVAFNVLSLADNPTFTSAVAAWETSLQAVTNGQIYRTDQSTGAIISNAAGAAGSAREYKLLLTYEDSVTLQLYTVSVPTFDVSTVTMIAGTDNVDLTIAPMPTFKTNFEALAASPAGNTVTLISARLVGRNI